MDFKQIVRNHLSPMVIAREPEIVDELALHLSDLYHEGLAEGLSHDDALSVVLLVGAGLFLRTLHNALSIDLGYRIDNVLVASVNLDVRGYAQDAGQAAYAQILERVRAIPGVEGAGAARVAVLSGAARTIAVSSDGRPVARDGSNGIDVRANTITEGYLDVLGIRLLRGRNFAAADRAGATPVAIVSERLAARLHPGVDPIGRSVRVGPQTVLQIVGVVPDTVYRSGIEQNAPPILYAPLAQNYESGMTLHVRTGGDPLALVPSIRRAVQSVDPQLVLNGPSTLRELFGDSLDDQRMMATLVGVSGALALLLAAVGVYGVMAHAASQRTSEIGIRLALGARPASILRLMLGEGLRLVLFGSLLGLAGAFAGARYLEAQLFGGPNRPGDVRSRLGNAAAGRRTGDFRSGPPRHERQPEHRAARWVGERVGLRRQRQPNCSGG